MAREDRYERLRVSRYTGLDMNTAKIHMDEGAGRYTSNFDFRRIGAARIRPGYARVYISEGGRVQTATDDFNRANGSIGANWTVSSGNVFEVDTNRLKHTSASGAGGVARYTATSFPADQYASVKLAVLGNAVGPVVRAGASQVYLFIGSAPGYWDLVRVNYITVAAVGLASNNAGPTPAAGDVLELRAEGTSLRGYVNGALIVSATDSVLTSGSPGIMGYGAAGGTDRVDDFAAGAISLIRTPVLVTQRPSRLFAFERDDDESRLVIADGSRLEQFGETLPEWDE